VIAASNAGEHPPTCPQDGQIDARLVKQILSAIGELMVPIVEGVDCPGGQQAVAQLHTTPSGQVVVARPRLEHAAGDALLLQRANRSRRRNLGNGLQHGGHLRVDDLVVSMPALHPDPDQPALGQPAQVRGSGTGTHRGPPGQLPRRQRPTTTQRREHRRTRRIVDQVRDRGEVPIGRRG